METRTRGQRAGIDRGAVLGAAKTLLVERGLRGLTIRALSARLGIAPNAIYSHVRDKADLLDALLDDVLATVPHPISGSPRDRLMAIMAGSYDVLLEQRELVPLYLLRQGARGPAAVALGQDMRAALEEAGHTDQAERATRTLIIMTIGSAAFAVEADRSADRQAELRDAFLDGIGWLLSGILARSSGQAKPPASDFTPDD